MILETASYQDLKNFCKEEIANTGTNPFGMYHMLSKAALQAKIKFYLEENSTVEKSLLETTNSVEEVKTDTDSSVGQAIVLLKRTIAILQQVVEEDCNCDKLAQAKELEELAHLANLIIVTI